MADFEELLEMTKKELMQEAEDQGYNFSNQTRKAVIAKEMADDIVTKGTQSEATRSEGWDQEFKKAAEQALRKTLEEDRSYTVFEKQEGENMFNVAPAYMKWTEERKVPLLTITRYANV